MNHQHYPRLDTDPDKCVQDFQIELASVPNSSVAMPLIVAVSLPRASGQLLSAVARIS